MKRKLTCTLMLPAFALAHFVQTSSAQINLIAGTYHQNFNTLASSASGDTNWLDNSTLPGWYASQGSGGAVTNYRVSTGSSTASALYSFGSSANGDRALGSQAGGTPADFAYGVRLTNDTANAMTIHPLASLTKLVKPRQIVFGTDFPFLTAKATAAGLREVGLFSAMDLQAIERGNAAGLMPRYKI